MDTLEKVNILTNKIIRIKKIFFHSVLKKFCCVEEIIA